jgi:hypothetical protein
MIVRRELLTAAMAATDANDTGRYFGNTIQIRRSGDVVGTDGHIAVIVRDAHPFDPAEFPIVPGADIHGELAADLVVPVPTCKRLIGATAKGKRALPILSGIQIGRNGSEGVSVLAATDLSVPAVATIQQDPGQTYPAIDRVVPAADADLVRVTLAVPVLEAMIKACKAVSGSKALQSVTLQIPKPGEKDKNVIVNALRLEIAGDSGISVTGAVMPCRL